MNIFEYFRKNKQNIFIITVIGFIAGIFLGFGGYIRSSYISTTAATVNGVKIPISRYNNLVNYYIEEYRSKNQEFNEEIIKKIKQEVLRDLIQEEIFWQEAKKNGIFVTDQELYYDIMNIPAFKKNGKFDRETYYRTLILKLKTTPKEFEESRRRRIAIFKLREFITQAVKLSNPEIQYYLKTQNIKTEEEKKKFYENLLNEKRTAVFISWFNQIANETKIKVFIKD